MRTKKTISKKNPKQLSFNFPKQKNLLQAEKIRPHVEGYKKFFENKRLERKNTISKHLQTRLSKKNLNQLNDFFKRSYVNVGSHPINIFMASVFSEDKIREYLKNILHKKNKMSEKEANKKIENSSIKDNIKFVYSNSKITLKERIFIRFLYNHHVKNLTLTEKYKRFLELKKKYEVINTTEINKLKKDKDRRVSFFENLKRISSQEKKEAEENIKHLNHIYNQKTKNIKDKRKNIGEEIKKTITEIKDLIPEIRAYNDVINLYETRELKR